MNSGPGERPSGANHPTKKASGRSVWFEVDPSSATPSSSLRRGRGAVARLARRAPLPRHLPPFAVMTIRRRGTPCLLLHEWRLRHGRTARRAPSRDLRRVMLRDFRAPRHNPRRPAKARPCCRATCHHVGLHRRVAYSCGGFKHRDAITGRFGRSAVEPHRPKGDTFVPSPMEREPGSASCVRLDVDEIASLPELIADGTKPNTATRKVVGRILRR